MSDLESLPDVCRAALEAHAPEYFALDAAGRTAWRARYANDRTPAMDAVSRELLKSVLGLSDDRIAALNDPDAHDRLEYEQMDRINAVSIHLQGVGPHSVMLNEWLADGKTILSWDTLRLYDEDQHDFQVAAAAEHGHPKSDPTYRGDLYGCWARARIDGELTYLTLSMASGHILSEMESAGFDIVQELVPYTYEPGPEHMKDVGGGCVRWDMHVNANGQEALQKHLSDAARTHANARFEAISREMHDAGKGVVWILSNPDDRPGARAKAFVYSDITALDAVRMEHLVGDTLALQDTSSWLMDRVAEEIAGLRAHLEAEASSLAPA